MSPGLEAVSLVSSLIQVRRAVLRPGKVASASQRGCGQVTAPYWTSFFLC